MEILVAILFSCAVILLVSGIILALVSFSVQKVTGEDWNGLTNFGFYHIVFGLFIFLITGAMIFLSPGSGSMIGVSG